MRISKDLKKEMEEVADIIKLFPETVQDKVFDYLIKDGMADNVNQKEGRNSSKKNNDRDDLKRNEENESEEEFSINNIVNAIRESEKFDLIETRILNKSNQLNRILLCFYFIQKLYPHRSVTTGTIESITDQLNVKITHNNVGTKINDEQKYFAADDVRKPGAHVHYKINRKGIQKFESLIDE